MKLSQYIINDIDLQPISQTVGAFKAIFKEFTYTHLPVAENDVYIGLIAENDLRCFDETKTLTEYRYAIENVHADVNENWLEVLAHFGKLETNLLPLINPEDQKYLGYIELIDLLGIFSSTPFLQQEGALVVIEKSARDYTLSEVTQIAEQANQTVLGLFISETDLNKVQITLKIGSQSITEVLAAFRRYDYQIVSLHQEDRHTQTIKERSNYLKKYLDI
ncbi:CBS domain-containing protein [Mesonia sp. HuA40]|uniref:CBS domain-containing protein n=1 Tax=Mesonia sp. HuA40 TaxID=2602761 RepID=UPI0011CBC5D1|nr:CBS domain-containing protein [Mesonia sp. HuA40]TXK73259.1 CBS domain-containing protein [Mesonia sp. HuA40]